MNIKQSIRDFKFKVASALVKKEINLNSFGFNPNSRNLFTNLVSSNPTVDSMMAYPMSNNAIVFESIKKIAENIASCRIKVGYRSDKTNDEVTSGSVYNLFNNPNRFNTQMEFVNQFLTYLEHDGEIFVLFGNDYNGIGTPSSMWCYRGIYFTEITDPVTGMLLGWQYNGNSPMKTLNPEKVLHIKFTNPYNQWRGISPLQAAQLAISLDLSASDYNVKFFENGATVSIAITTKEELSDAAWERYLKMFEQRHKGGDRAHKIAVIEGGQDIKELGSSIKDMDYSNLKNISQKEIMAVFGVNEVVLGFFSDIKCFTSDIEILTEKGFKFVDKITIKDKVASFNPKSQNAEYKKITKVYDYDYDGDIYEQEDLIISYKITPEHNLIGKKIINKREKGNYKKRNYELSDFHFEKIKDVTKCKNFLVPRNAKWTGNIIKEIDITKRDFERGEYKNKSKNGLKDTKFEANRFLSFIGWYISEGCLFSRKVQKGGNAYGIFISQTKPKGVLKFKSDLFGFEYKIEIVKDKGFRVYGKDLYYYLKENFGSKCYNKKIPRDILNLDPSLLQYLFDSLMEGDGTKAHNSWVYTTTSNQLAEDVYELSIKLGFAPSLRGGKDGFKSKQFESAKPYWQVCIPTKKQSDKYGRIGNVKISKYKGKVYCLEVPPYHTVMIRHNNRVMWIGQSYEGIRAAWKNFWIGTLLPLIKTIEDKFNNTLLANIEGGKYIVYFDLSNVEALQEELSQKLENAFRLIRIGYSRNQVNKKLNLGMPITDAGEMEYIPLNLLPATDYNIDMLAQQTGNNSQTTSQIAQQQNRKPKESSDKNIQILDKNYLDIINKHEGKLSKCFFSLRKSLLENNNNHLTITNDIEKVFKDIYSDIKLEDDLASNRSKSISKFIVQEIVNKFLNNTDEAYLKKYFNNISNKCKYIISKEIYALRSDQ